MSLIGQASDVWRRVYEQYEHVLKAKAEGQKDVKKRKKLLDLDGWYHQELPALISKRPEKYITHEELGKLMTWKLTRGKFRPSLQKLVDENSSDSVITASKKAFKALPSLKAAIEALTVLRGVGPATASAILAAGAPEQVPFMADESMMALPGLQPLQYTLSAFLNYAEQVQKLTKGLQKEDSTFEWTAHRVEVTLWTLQMAKMLKLDSVLALLQGASDNFDDVKGCSQTVKRKSAETNGKLKKKKKE